MWIRIIWMMIFFFFGHWLPQLRTWSLAWMLFFLFFRQQVNQTSEKFWLSHLKQLARAIYLWVFLHCFQKLGPYYPIPKYICRKLREMCKIWNVPHPSCQPEKTLNWSLSRSACDVTQLLLLAAGCRTTPKGRQHKICMKRLQSA